jgi:hypothetical protein
MLDIAVSNPSYIVLVLLCKGPQTLGGGGGGGGGGKGGGEGGKGGREGGEGRGEGGWMSKPNVTHF